MSNLSAEKAAPSLPTFASCDRRGKSHDAICARSDLSYNASSKCHDISQVLLAVSTCVKALALFVAQVNSF